MLHEKQPVNLEEMLFYHLDARCALNLEIIYDLLHATLLILTSCYLSDQVVSRAYQTGMHDMSEDMMQPSYYLLDERSLLNHLLL
jgi:hypothetical protein